MLKCQKQNLYFNNNINNGFRCIFFIFNHFHRHIIIIKRMNSDNLLNQNNFKKLISLFTKNIFYSINKFIFYQLILLYSKYNYTLK